MLKVRLPVPGFHWNDWRAPRDEEQVPTLWIFGVAAEGPRALTRGSHVQHPLNARACAAPLSGPLVPLASQRVSAVYQATGAVQVGLKQACSSHGVTAHLWTVLKEGHRLQTHPNNAQPPHLPSSPLATLLTIVTEPQPT